MALLTHGQSWSACVEVDRLRSRVIHLSACVRRRRVSGGMCRSVGLAYLPDRLTAPMRVGADRVVPVLADWGIARARERRVCSDR